MFGSCGIGEVAISKVTLIRRQRYYTHPNSIPAYNEDSLILSNVKLLRGISFSAGRDLTIIPHDRAAAIDTSSEVFVPENLELTVAYLEDISRVKNFVRAKSSMFTAGLYNGNAPYEYILKLEFPNKTLFCDVIYKEDTVDTYTVVDKWSFSLVRTSMYYKIKPLTIYTYGVNEITTLTTQFGGDVDGSLMLTGRWLINKADIYIGLDALSIMPKGFNSLGISASAYKGQYFHYSSIPTLLYMKSADIEPDGFIAYADLSQARDFTKSGYLRVPPNTQTIYVFGILPVEEDSELYPDIFGGAGALFYEYYYNI